MKKSSIALFALAAALAITPVASATTFDFTFTGSNLDATGTLTGSMVAPGVFDITSGTINITGSSMNGIGILVPIPSSGVFETGGGSNIFGFSGTGFADSVLYPGQNPQINDITGIFLFDITSGAGAGDGLGIWSNSPDNYGGFGGNWNFYDNGGDSFSAAVAPTAPTPEPSSLLLLGTGLLGLAFFAFRKAKSTDVFHTL